MVSTNGSKGSSAGTLQLTYKSRPKILCKNKSNIFLGDLEDATLTEARTKCGGRHVLPSPQTDAVGCSQATRTRVSGDSGRPRHSSLPPRIGSGIYCCYCPKCALRDPRGVFSGQRRQQSPEAVLDYQALRLEGGLKSVVAATP